MPGPEEPEQAPPSPIYIPYVPEPGHLETALGEIRVLQASEHARADAPEGAENGIKESGPKANYKVKPRCNTKPKLSTINHYHQCYQCLASGHD
nr:hypothetical protein [Tanacetum cinerariifolium]